MSIHVMAHKRVKNNRRQVRGHRIPAIAILACAPAIVVSARAVFASAVAVLGSATVLAVVAAGASWPALGASGAHRWAPARQARRLSLVENAQLHLTNEGEATLNERGQATGTFDAPVTSRLKLSPGHVTGTFVVYPKGGSISGRAQARFVVRSSVGYYGGTLTITRGTGAYRHASGSNIGISGTINRLSFALTIKVNGWMSL
jgi:hypothetical protein